MAKPQRLLTYDELPDHGVNFSRRHLRYLEDKGKFPQRVPTGDHSVAWVEDEIDAYVAEKIKARERLPRPGQKKKRGDDAPRLNDDAA
jgi:predicted DNA-binding transcriptional regulator AlpA